MIFFFFFALLLIVDQLSVVHDENKKDMNYNE